jgi:hypothetical protein
MVPAQQSSEEQVNFTLRLPKSLRDHLLAQSDQKSRSLNSHIQAILENHLVATGIKGNHLVSRSGRSFEVLFEKGDSKTDLLGTFLLRELKYEKHRARYIIGLAEDLTDDWHINKSVRDETIKSLGLALLNHYNELHEIDRLSWPHPHGRTDYDGFRLLEAKDVMPASSLAHFLELLAEDKWRDSEISEKEQSQDFRRGRNPANLY